MKKRVKESSTPGAENPSRVLRKLFERIQSDPFRFLPERSPGALKQFFFGYSEAGARIETELGRFQEWLLPRLGGTERNRKAWWWLIQLHSKDDYDGYCMFIDLFAVFAATTNPTPDSADTRLRPKTSLFHFLAMAREKPGMYFGGRISTSHLAAFINGWFTAKDDFGTRPSREEKEFQGFEKWLQRVDTMPPTIRWHRIIENHCAGDSFGSFYARLDEFLTNRGKRPRGLDERFVWDESDGVRWLRRRTLSERPKSILLSTKPTVWWRSIANAPPMLPPQC